jgi:hypothetical protein
MLVQENASTGPDIAIAFTIEVAEVVLLKDVGRVLDDKACMLRLIRFAHSIIFLHPADIAKYDIHLFLLNSSLYSLIIRFTL